MDPDAAPNHRNDQCSAGRRPARYPHAAETVVDQMGETGSCRGERGCKAYGRDVANQPALTDDPLCDACLDCARPDIRALVYDYLDLAQLHETSLSQAISEKTAGSKESPMLLAGQVEELQAEILHVTTTWEGEVRSAANLTTGRRLPVPAWATTRSHPLPLVRVRAGAAVQRALGILLPRLRNLSLLPAVAVRPAGIEDDPEDVAGWEAVHHLQSLHGRARAALGRTRRTFWIPGECWSCDARPVRGVDGPLYRSEPRRFEDPMEVRCDKCGAIRPYPDYEHYMTGLLWPDLAAELAAA